VPGDEIVGFITQGRGISVHRNDCEQFSALIKQQPEREVEVQWGENEQQGYHVTVQIIASDRQGLLRDISTIIANDRVSIIGMDSHTDSPKQVTTMTLDVEIANNQILARLLSKLTQLNDVINVKRM
jgi:GTP pyrophosphokinase